MNLIDTLQAERDSTTAELQTHQRELDTERRKASPNTTELTRLRSLIAECERQIVGIEDDLAFARRQQHSAEAIAERAAGRQRRDRALDGTAATKALQRLDRALGEAVEAASEFTEAQTERASLACGVAWLAHPGDQAGARNVAGNAISTLVGSDAHALAIAQHVQRLLQALPPSLRNRLSSDYSFGAAFALSGRLPMRLLDAHGQAEANLQRHIGGLLDEPQQDRSAA